VQQLEDRLSYLGEEKDITLRDYQSKISGHEKQIEMNKRELDELQRINGNKDTDNDSVREKLIGNKDKLKQSNNEY